MPNEYLAGLQLRLESSLMRVLAVVKIMPSNVPMLGVPVTCYDTLAETSFGGSFGIWWASLEGGLQEDHNSGRQNSGYETLKNKGIIAINKRCSSLVLSS